MLDNVESEQGEEQTPEQMFNDLIYRLLRVGHKLRGMGTLLGHEDFDDTSMDDRDARAGIGMVLDDLGKEVAVLADGIEHGHTTLGLEARKRALANPPSVGRRRAK